MASPPITGPSLANTPGVNQTNILNAVVPPEGPKSAAVTLDFSTATSILVDFTITTAQGKISTIQMIYMDNSSNDAPVNIAVEGTSQNVTVPAGCQGWFPMVATNRPKFVCTCAAGAIVSSLWLNVPVAQGYWFPNGNGLVAASPAALATAIANGGTPEAVWASTATSSVPSDGAIITNPFAASESLFVDIINNADTIAPGANGTTEELLAGGSFIVPPNFQGTVTANAITSGHTFTAYGVGHG